MHEASFWPDSSFITLTIDDEHLSPKFTLLPKDLQLYFKRLRRDLKEGESIKYFACGEYGEMTSRPHYHAIVFGLGPLDKRIKENWGQGFVKAGSVTYDSCHYVAGYIQKKLNGPMGKEAYGDREPPFMRCSRGIGERWMKENEDYLIRNLGLTVKGKEMGLPRYYKKKLIDKIDPNRLEKAMIERADKRYEWLTEQGVGELERSVYEAECRRTKALELSQRLSRYKPRDT